MSSALIRSTALSSCAVIFCAAASALAGDFFGHGPGSIAGGSRWDAAPRVIGVNERSLNGGLRFSMDGGSYQAYRDLFKWTAVPSVPDFAVAVQQAFGA